MLTKVDKHKRICKELNDLYARKNADYGDSFGKSYKEYGLTMACIRLEDKLNRIKALSKQAAQVSDESITDTLMDLANYSIMTLVELGQGDTEKQKMSEATHSEHCTMHKPFPNCQCLTCARDHGHSVGETPCCIELNKQCHHDCPDYVKEAAESGTP